MHGRLWLIVSKVEEIAFFNGFVTNVSEFDADAPGMIEGSFEVEVADVETDEFFTGMIENAVDLNFEDFK